MVRLWGVLLALVITTAGWAEGRNDEFHAACLEKIIIMESELLGLSGLEGTDQIEATAARLESFTQTILPLTEAPSFARPAAMDALDLISVTAELVDEKDDNVMYGVGFLLETVRQIRGILEKPVRYQ